MLVKLLCSLFILTFASARSGQEQIRIAEGWSTAVIPDNSDLFGQNSSRGSDSVRNYSIFGPRYSRVHLISRNLEGVVYYLVAGHGGPDSGSRGHRNGHVLCEDEYAYDVTLRLARQLISRGATVYIIVRDPSDGIRDASYLLCDSDETVRDDTAIPVGQLDRLKQRVGIINTLHRKNRKVPFQRLLVLHVDSRQKGDRVDIYFYHHSSSRGGRQTAGWLRTTIDKKYDVHQPSRGYHGTVAARDALYLLRKTRVPAVYIELGNIRNIFDQKRFIYSDNRQAMANWLCDGLENDYAEYLKRRH